MCGIVGVISGYMNGFTVAEQDIFRDMLFFDTLRGWDSTGVFLVTNTGNVSIRKKAIHGADFLRTEAYKDLKSKAYMKGMFMIGHNRAATKGAVNDLNAHPFWVDDKIVLVQNGTYRGSHKHHKDVEVDTEAIAHVIAEHDDNIELALQKINAAYALVWYNTQKKTLHLVRNSERPLFIVKTSDGGMLFASEYETILHAASRAKQKIVGYPEMLEEGEMWTFTLGQRNWSVEKTKLDYSFRQEHAPKVEYTYHSVDSEYDYTEWWKNKNRYRGDHQRHVENVRSTVREAINAANSTNQNEVSMFKYVAENKFEEFRLTNKQIVELRDCFRQIRPDQVAVEFIDYLPAYPDDINCSKWYAYGQTVTPYHEDAKALVYTVLTDKNELDVIQLLENELFTAQVPGSIVSHHVTLGKDDSYDVASLFVTNLIPVVTETVESEDGLH